jgi:SAM-dependent methyltransferase
MVVLRPFGRMRTSIQKARKETKGVAMVFESAASDVTWRPTELSDVWPNGALERVDQCLLCGNRQAVVLYQGLKDNVCFCAPGRWTFYRCTRCESVYLDPRPTAATIGHAYAKYHTHEENAEPPPPRGLTGRLRRALRNGYLNARYRFDLRPALTLGQWVIGLLPAMRCRNDRKARVPLPHRGARLLDIGCGNGAFVKDAIAWGWNAEGLDPDPDVAAAVSPRLGARVTTGTLADTHYPDACFAAVTMDHTIEHVHDPVSTLREALRILQPRGSLWVATPNVDSLGHRWFKSDWRGLEPPRHLVLFNAKTLRAALATAGYEKVRQLRAPLLTRWVFTRSYLIARGDDPLAEHGAPLPLSARLLALMADWWGFAVPSYAEELIFVAQRPASGASR